MTDRQSLEHRWLHLTRTVMPGLAGARGWPVRNDHCFQRILLDAACGRCWYDAIAGRPAYKAIDADRLAKAVDLADAVIRGDADLAQLNAQSLNWRGKGSAFLQA